MHVDHVAGDMYVAEKYGLPVMGCEDDAFLGERISQQVKMFGLPVNVDDIKIAQMVKHGDVLRLGDEEIKVLQVPGHSPGSVVLYCEASKLLVSGDALFSGGIGRTDLPGGDYSTLINAIKTQILSLPEDVVVYPGHGPETTVGDERRYNSFLR
jgi:glyoxylase-like metal-dependent hydrolase (beta-lactamase superfamily II)